jgi:ParB family chromosome partitioning protein
MAEAAERLLEGKGWLPPLLRTAPQVAEDGEAAGSVEEEESVEVSDQPLLGDADDPEGKDDEYVFAAE